jgi:preprotein translocase subunit SecG
MLLSFFAGLLTVILVLDCLFLLLLILIQLPKKEAGLGQAFGSSTTDALFGSGSGTALTKMTKYAAVIFFVITFGLAILNAQQSKARLGGRLRESIEKANKAAAAQAPAPGATQASNPPIKVEVPEIRLTNPPAAPAAPAVPASPLTPSTPPTNKPAAPQPK